MLVQLPFHTPITNSTDCNLFNKDIFSLITYYTHQYAILYSLSFVIKLNKTIITHCVVRKKTKKKSLKREKLDSRRCGRGFLNSGRGFLISGRGRG